MDALGGYGSSSASEGEEEKIRAPARATAASRRGKKILSLASVLPPHILDQLTKADDDADSIGSSSSDDGDDEGRTEKKPKVKSSADKGSHHQDPGISSLLTDLKKARPEHDPQKPKPAAATQPLPLGAAFLTSVTTTTLNKKGSVRDIHADDESSPNVEKPAATGTQHQQSSTTFPAAVNETMIRASSSKPASFIARTNAAPRRVVAAPPATAGVASAIHQEQQAPRTQQQKSLQQSAPPPQPKPKRSRKEMERALRQGKLAEVLQEGGGLTMSLQAADPSSYQPVAAPAAAASAGSSTVRNVPTQMYDPSTGSTVTVMMQGKGGGSGGGANRKNQINQLLSQAAHLEQQRQQQPGSSAAKAHRANAKRKYGW